MAFFMLAIIECIALNVIKRSTLMFSTVQHLFLRNFKVIRTRKVDAPVFNTHNSHQHLWCNKNHLCIALHQVHWAGRWLGIYVLFHSFIFVHDSWTSTFFMMLSGSSENMNNHANEKKEGNERQKWRMTNKMEKWRKRERERIHCAKNVLREFM